MIGLIVLVGTLVYVTLIILATRWAYRWAKGKGFTKGKCLVSAALGFLVVYLPVFWDHVPTLLAKQYLCVTESRFQVLKSVEIWKGENPFTIESLPNIGSSGSPTKDETFDDGREKRTTYFLSDHIAWIVSQKDVSTFLPVIRIEQHVTDIKKDNVLVSYVNFSTGNSVRHTVGPPGPLKFWLSTGSCWGNEINQDLMRKIRDEFVGRKG